ncbi:MAG TPA: N-acetylmuramoyl-L-alanine amidase [Terrimicrobiaceae bacterium]
MKNEKDRHSVQSLRFSLLLVWVVLTGCASPYKQGAGKFETVIVDAGHGGFDRGGRSISGAPEKLLALDTARRLAKVLEKSGFRVIETRTGDVFIPLGSRTARSNSTAGSIFVSIHYNWAPRRGARGIEIYFYSPRSWRLASNILRETTRAYPTENRGVKRNNFYVLRKNRRPAVLCELGFVSNPEDNRYLQNSKYRQRVAERVAAGIVAERKGARP